MTLCVTDGPLTIGPPLFQIRHNVGLSEVETGVGQFSGTVALMDWLLQTLTRFDPLVKSFAALASLTVALVALFKDRFWAWIDRPQITVELSLKPPDCLLMPFGAGDEWAPSYQFRIRISNVGKTTAQGVEVYVNSLAGMLVDGSSERQDWFLPMNLTWAHTQQLTATDIPPTMERMINFGAIVEPRYLEIPVQTIPQMPNGFRDSNQTLFTLYTPATPSNFSNWIFPGNYALHLIVTAKNARARSIMVTLRISGEWQPDEGRMFGNHARLAIKSDTLIG
jgi:hypothetical protein